MASFNKSRLAKLEAAKTNKGFPLIIIQPCHPEKQAAIRDQARREGRSVVEVFTGVPRPGWSEPWAVEWLRANKPAFLKHAG